MGHVHENLGQRCYVCDIIDERDAIKAENERLKDALKQIRVGTYSSVDLSYKDIARAMMAIAEEALSVSKANTPTQGGEGE